MYDRTKLNFLIFIKCVSNNYGRLICCWNARVVLSTNSLSQIHKNFKFDQFGFPFCLSESNLKLKHFLKFSDSLIPFEGLDFLGVLYVFLRQFKYRGDKAYYNFYHKTVYSESFDIA